MAQSFYRWHWLPQHAGTGLGGLFTDEADLFRKTPHDIIKIVWTTEEIPYLDRLPSGCKVLYRNQPLSENWNNRGIASGAAALSMAEAHHASMKRTADWAQAHGLPLSRLWLSSLNEPQFPQGGGKEPYDLLVTYWLRLLDLNHADGINTIVGEFGVGWPPDKGFKDSPPDFEPFHPVYDKLLQNDRWSAHPYWGGLGVDFWWDWLAGRMGQRPAWMRGKKWWATETGSDFCPNSTGAVSPSKGWLTYPGTVAEKAARYVPEQAHFEQRIRSEDPDLEYAFTFTLDGNRDDWGRFELLIGEYMQRFMPYVNSDVTFTPPPPPTPPPEPTPPPIVDEFNAALLGAFGAHYADLRAKLPTNPASPYYPYAKRSVVGILRYTVHHSASPSSTTTWQGIAEWHIAPQGNNWPGIGYTLGIAPDGRVALLNDLTTACYHDGTKATAWDDNATDLGICLLGCFQPGVSGIPEEQPTAAAIAALKTLVGALDRYLGRAPEIVGHRDVAHVTPPETQCPGDNIEPLLPTLRQAAPVDVPAAIIVVGKASRVINATPDFALWKKFTVDGLQARSNEVETIIGGQPYVLQLCGSWNDAVVYAYFCKKGDWLNVQRVLVS